MVFCVVQIIPNTMGMNINDLLGVFSSREKAQEFIDIRYKGANNIKILPYIPDLIEWTER